MRHIGFLPTLVDENQPKNHGVNERIITDSVPFDSSVAADRNSTFGEKEL